MKCEITARKVNLTDKEKAYIEEKLAKLEKVYRRILHAHITVNEERFGKHVEVTMKINHGIIVASESAGDVYTCIDQAVAALKKQLLKRINKVKLRRRRSAFQKIKNVMFGAFSSRKREDGPAIIKTKLSDQKPMSAEEASLELKVMGKQFIVFRNADNGQINVIYKRKDGNHILVEM